MSEDDLVKEVQAYHDRFAHKPPREDYIRRAYRMLETIHVRKEHWVFAADRIARELEKAFMEAY